VVEACIAAGLVGGEGFAVDASLIAADANKQRSIPGKDWDKKRDPETASRAVKEYLATLDDAAFGAASDVAPKFVSPSDPAAQWTGAMRGPAFFAYADNYLIDVKFGIIMDVEASRAIRQAEVGAAKTMIERTEERFDLKPERLAADTAYGSAANLNWLVNEKGISPHIPVIDKSKREDGTFSREDFTFDKALDIYTTHGHLANCGTAREAPSFAHVSCVIRDENDHMISRQERLVTVMQDIDSANADDPRRIIIGDKEMAYEVAYSERMSERLSKMYPTASEILKIAARAQHLRRWEIPRSAYPDGRIGYNDWRKTCREHHTELVGAILARRGFTPEEITQVARLIRKEQLKKDPESQALENVVDVVFIEHYMEEFLAKYSHYDENKVVDIVGKILRKMSPKGHAEALLLPLAPRIRFLIENAMTREADALARLAKTAID
jgi:hypothetical protein